MATSGALRLTKHGKIPISNVSLASRVVRLIYLSY